LSRYVPLCAAGLFRDGRFAALGVKNFLKDCNQVIGADEFQCHYLEPMASDPGQRETRALLLAPVVDINQPGAPWRLALFTSSDQPMRFRHKSGVWHAGRQVTVPAGGGFSQRCWLMIHSGEYRDQPSMPPKRKSPPCADSLESFSGAIDNTKNRNETERCRATIVRSRWI